MRNLYLSFHFQWIILLIFFSVGCNKVFYSERKVNESRFKLSTYDKEITRGSSSAAASLGIGIFDNLEIRTNSFDVFESEGTLQEKDLNNPTCESYKIVTGSITNKNSNSDTINRRVGLINRKLVVKELNDTLYGDTLDKKFEKIELPICYNHIPHSPWLTYSLLIILQLMGAVFVALGFLTKSLGLKTFFFILGFYYTVAAILLATGIVIIFVFEG